jgi:hypothetical protein
MWSECKEQFQHKTIIVQISQLKANMHGKGHCLEIVNTYGPLAQGIYVLEYGESIEI